FYGETYCIGIGGGWSSDVATELFAEADLVIAIGASLTGFTTHSGKLYPRAGVVHIDVNPRAVRHNRAVAHFHLRADALLGVVAVNNCLARLVNGKIGYRTPETATQLKRSPDRRPDKCPDGMIDPNRAIQAIDRVVPKDWFLVGGSGHCAYF